MNHNSIPSLLNLINTKRLGPLRVRMLVSHFKSPENVFRASRSELCRVDLIDEGTAAAILNYKDHDFGKLELNRAEKINVKIVTLWDENYPFLLKKTHAAPVLLYCRGLPLKKKEDNLAVIGSRKITDYGIKTTTRLVSELCRSGLSITSGLAVGVDSVAHKTALKYQGRTLAVLGNGIDFIYPPQNKKLARKICENGTIISEFFIGADPDPGNFPRRNRIISGLSHGTLVIEAGNRSGSILTALMAIDQNRDVFAVPGRISDKMSIGCNRLIRNGAIPVESGEDIIKNLQNCLFFPIKEHQQTLKLKLNKREKTLVGLLSKGPQHIDRLVKKADQDTASVLTTLLELELKGVVIQLRGKQFIEA
ncbi:MAG: DNA-processing protein DprA [Candidatus Neomarinimicrobiota bacterium]